MDPTDLPSDPLVLDRAGRLLRAVREVRGETQAEVAERAGLSASAVARIEGGSRRPSEAALSQLCRGLAVPVAQLVAALADPKVDGDELLYERAIELVPPDARSSDVVLSSGGHRRSRRPNSAPRAAEPMANEPRGDYPPRSDPRLAALDAGLREQLLALAEELGASPPERMSGQLSRLRDELMGGASRTRRPGSLPVAAIPTGEVWYVFPQHVAIDNDGHAWIDPLAPARPGGLADEDVRVERYVDGRIVVDPVGLREPLGEARDDARHRQRVRRADAPPDETELLQVADAVVIVAAAADAVDAGGEAPPWRPPAGHLAVVLTATNPSGRLLTASENQERLRVLARELDREGAGHDDYRRAEVLIRDLADAWREPAFAVLGIDRDRLLDIAEDYEQRFVHLLHGDDVEVVPIGGPDE